MCGIVGIRRFDGAPVDPATLRAMAGQVAHRGPDAEGYWCDGSVGFGHRRLSIIDVAGSHQPMTSAGGRCHVAFNGEILNFRDLRRGLAYPFGTDGDTEVLLAAFALSGPAAVERLHGQFAFAVHDAASDDLWLFRDRLGILPLYWYADDRMLCFASEVKALLPALPRPAEVDEASLAAYLAHGSVPAPHTLFKGVDKLPQGHRLRAGADGRLEVSPYWAVPSAGEPLRVTDAEAVDLVARALRDSVEAAMVADVPVGAYLSGGLDSSLIVALMSNAAGATVETFAAGFGDPRVDELPFARRVSRLCGTRHEEVVVGPADFERLWPELTWNRDAPLSQPADVALYRLASAASRRVKVVLSGEGSDELFGGYPKHRFGPWAAAAGVLPPAVRAAVLRPAERLLPARANRLRVALRAMGAADADERIGTWFAPFTAAERRRLLGEVGGRPPEPTQWPPGQGDLLRRMLYADCHGWLADNLLERGDRMSMAASLELRPPFLDHRLVELAFSLPSRMKVRGGRGKWVVKEVARRHLPADVVDRRKVGFRVPLDAWFRGALRPLARDLLCSPTSFVGHVMDAKVVAGLLDSHERGRTNEELRIWTLLSLEVWHQACFGRTRPARAA